nr:hypothetical protein [Tanacetum cinerariifolium]
MLGLTDRKSASIPIDTKKRLLKDPNGEDVDVHTYKSIIGSLMYLTSSRPDIMFALCACARFQVTPKASHLHAVMRILRYLKGKPHLGLWYPKDPPFNLVAYSDSNYPGASLDRKSTIEGCQFLGFADTHNMITYLTKSDASEGFEQILDFLNARVIQYALTVKPTIYVSRIKQFWSFVSLKKTNDVVRLQALIDRRKVIITEDTVQQALRLDDAESIDCLPNEEIFAELERMGVDTSWFKGMLVPKQVNDDVDDNVANAVKPTSPTPATTPPPPPQELLPSTSHVAPTLPSSPHQSLIAQPSSPQQNQQPSPPSQPTAISIDLLNAIKGSGDWRRRGRGCIQTEEKIAELDADEDVTLEEVAADLAKDADAQGRQEESQAQVY